MLCLEYVKNLLNNAEILGRNTSIGKEQND